MRPAFCYICGSCDSIVVDEQDFRDPYIDLIDPAYQEIQRRLVACTGCGFVYHSPLLDDYDIEVLYARYRDNSFRGETPDEYFDRITGLPPEQSENAAKVAWLKRHLPDEGRSAGALLDAGCGGGVFIHAFLKNFSGWDACGVEPTPAFAELAARRLARPVVTGSFGPGLFGQTFDLITTIQVLEHIPDPVAFLERIRQDLAPGGRLYVEVPDVADFAHLPPDHDRFVIQHLWVFSETSLANVCHRAGFSVIAMDHQTTIRGKRNLAMLLTADQNAVGRPLLREPAAAAVELRRAFLAGAAPDGSGG